MKSTEKLSFLGAVKLLYYKLKLRIASAWADARHSQTKKAYFVLPDEKERLLVLSESGIQNLMDIHKVEYQNMFKSKLYIRKKDGVIKKKKTKVRCVGRKAFGVSRMRRKVTYKDLVEESFYYTGGLISKGNLPFPSEDVIKTKRKLWLMYLQQVKLRKDKKNEKNS